MATEKKYLDLEGLKTYDTSVKNWAKSQDTSTLNAAKSYADGLADNYEAAGSVATAKADLEKKIADAKKAGTDAQSSVSALTTRVTKAETDIGSTDNLATNSKNLVGALNEVKAAVTSGNNASAISISTEKTTSGMLKSYTIKQGTTTVGTIDIPKDMVVKAGEVVQLKADEVSGYEAGTYIKLTIANATNDVIYINVGTLVDIYKAKANATQVQIAIDSTTREISASIKAGSVGSTEIASGAITTVKIADDNVTKAKLAADVRTSLGKADSAEANAKTYADSLNTAMDTRVSAVETKLGTGTGSVTEQIATAKSEAISAAATDATTKADTAEKNAKGYADTKAAANKKLIDANTSSISSINTSLAAGGATANAIADAKKAGTDAQSGVNALGTRVTALESVSYVEISKEEIDSLFTTAG